MKKFLVLGSTLLSLGSANVSVAAPALIASEPNAHTSSAVSQKPAATVDAAEAKVMDFGAEPRRVLRVKSQVGDRQRSRMRMVTRPTIQIDGQPIPAFQIPVIELAMEMETTKVDADGSTHVSVTYLEPTISEGGENTALIESMLQEEFRALTQASFQYVFDPQGLIKEINFEFDGEDSSLTRKFLEEMSTATQKSAVILPKEAVGVGAVWSTPQSVSVNGLDINQNVTYRLIGIENDQLQLEFSLALDGQGSPLDVSKFLPLPAGVKTDVKSMALTGSGTMTLTLTQLVAQAMDFTSQVIFQMAFTEPDKQTVIVDMDMTSNIQILPE